MNTKVVITIDTEVAYHYGPHAFDRDVLGCTPSNERGVFWMSNELFAHGLAGVFFLDVYGSRRYGSAPYPDVCEKLLKLGHDIQLHTHPDQMYDPHRRYMHQYSESEQASIIRDGISLLKAWTGTPPIAHRAGSYGANEDTLKALQTNGIALDCSLYPGHKNCRLPFSYSNVPTEQSGIWEMPVTVAREPVVKLGYRLPFWTRRFWWRYQKLDVNTMNARQLCDSVIELRGKIPYIITFLHSFSFCRPDGTGFVPDHGAMESFRALLTMLVDKQFSVITCRALLAELSSRK